MISIVDQWIDRMLPALQAIRFHPASPSIQAMYFHPGASEAALGDCVAAALCSVGIVHDREHILGPGARVDFFCPFETEKGVPQWTGPGVGIELKKGRPARAELLDQVERYCEFERVRAVVVVSERGLRGMPVEVCGKPVVYVVVARSLGVAL